MKQLTELDASVLVQQLPSPAALFRGPELILVACNSGFRGMFSVTDPVGHPARDVLRPSLLERFASALEAVIATGNPTSGSAPLPQDDRGAGQSAEQILDFVHQPVRVDGQVWGVLSQLSDRPDDLRLERSRAFMAEANEALASSLDYETTLTTVTRLAVQGIADWCAVDELRPDGSIHRIAVAHPDAEKLELAKTLHERYPPRPDAPHGLSHVLRTGEPELVPEITDELLVAVTVDEEHLRIARALGLRSYIIVPLIARGAIMGALTLVSSESGRRFNESDLVMARELARRSAIAIDNARLYRESESVRERLEEQATELEAQATELEAQAEEMRQQAWQLEETQADLEATNIALGASAARLQATIDSSLDAVVTTDRHSTILEWSRLAEVLFGWSRAEAVGANLADTIIPAQFRERHRRGIERYLATGEGPILNRRIEITALRRDGREFPVELTVAPARFGDELVFNAFIRDITERKRFDQQRAAEHALARVLAESRTLIDAAPRALAAIGEALTWDVGGLWVLDLEHDFLRSVASWNAPGIDAAEFHAATRSITFRLGEGLPGRVWEARAPAWISDVARDMTFPRADAAARVGLHGAFAFPVLSGDEFLGVIEFLHREIVEPDEALLRSVAAIGSDIAQAVRRVQAEAERDRALAEVSRINADLEKTNAALEERSTEAERASRAKSEFLANMSHELRTPINAVIGYGELLETGVTGPVSDAQKAQLERIRASSEHLLALIDDILDFSKIGAGRIRVSTARVPLRKPLDAALGLVIPQATEKGLAVVDAVSHDPEPEFAGDEHRVRQILVNLFSNAVKFTHAGGTITVSSETAGPEGCAAESAEAGCVFIRVADTGIGIPADQLEAIFEPFTQVETKLTRAAGGTGLGLSISRELARLMGGDLTVESRPGEGSTFTLVLPRPSDHLAA